MHLYAAPGQVARQIRRRAVGHQHAAVEDGDAVAALGLVHVMGGDQQGGAGIGQLEQLLPEVAPRLGIHRAGRLIQEQQLRLMDHRRRQGQTLLLATAHGPGQLFLAVTEVVALDKLIHPTPGLRTVQPVHGGKELQVLAHGEVLEQRELLGHVADPQAQCFGLFGYAQAQHLDLAVAGRQQAAQHADGGRFAGAVRAEETVYVGPRHGQVHAVHGHQVAEAPGQAAGADGCRGRVIACLCRTRAFPCCAVHHCARSPALNSTSTGSPAGSPPAAGSSCTSAR